MKNKLFLQLLGLVLFASIIGLVSAVNFGADPILVASIVGLIVITFSGSTKLKSAFFTTNPDVSALTAYAGQYEKKLYSTLVNGMEFVEKNHVSKMLNVKSKMKLTKLKVTANVRTYSATEHLQGTAVYTGRDLVVTRGKSEFSIETLKYRDTWMNEVLAGTIDPTQIPFAQYLYDQIMKSIGAEINDRTFYFGFDTADAVLWDTGDTYAVGELIYFTPAGGVLHYYKCIASTSTGQSPSTHPAKWQNYDAESFFPGLKSYIDDAIAATTLTEVSTGAVTSGATALAAMKELFRAHDAPYKAAGVNIYCSYTDYEFLLDGITDKFMASSGRLDGTDGFLYLPDTDRKCKVIPVTWLNGSRRLISCPTENIVFGTNLLADFQKINIVQAELWTLKMGIVFEGGVQIRDLDALQVGDQA